MLGMKTQKRKDYFTGCDVADFVGGERHGDLSQSEMDTVAVFQNGKKKNTRLWRFPTMLGWWFQPILGIIRNKVITNKD